MADLSKLRFNGTDYNVKDASAPLRKFTNYSKTGNLPITSDDTTQTAIGKLEKALDGKINTSAKGTANGVAELDANGKVPSSQLPSYVDDVLEYSAKSSFPATGETGKIYVDTTTNKTYRWSGSAYVEISESLALGETSSTAYRGDRGKTAYDHSQTSGNPHGTTGAGVNLTGYSKGSSTAAVAATDTINAAIAKHENRIDTNKTNILSLSDANGAKNLLNVAENSVTASAAGFVVPETEIELEANKTYVISYNATATARSNFVAYSAIPTSASNKVVDVVIEAASSVVGQNSIEFTPSANVKVCKLYVQNFTGSVTFSNFMICTKSQFDISNAYQPYSLPNTAITPELIELCDSGAKNLFAVEGETRTVNTVTATYNSDGSITTSGTATGGNANFTILTLTAAQAQALNGKVLSGCPSGGSEDTYSLILQRNSSPWSVYARDRGTGAVISGVENVACVLILQIKENKSKAATWYPMICTQAAWNVSHKYVPYRPNWDLVSSVAPFYSVPINHSMIYRGQNLGATFTDAQHTALSSGNFTDLFLGDYWTKSVTIPAGTYTGGDGKEVTVAAQTVTLKAVIADFDTFYAGYTSFFAGINIHHAGVIVTGFDNVVWNKTNSTAGGYVASLIHKWLVGRVLPQLESWFGSAKVLSHQKLLTNAITGDAASGCEWSSQKISLLSECQLYGMKVWGGSQATNGAYEPGEAFKKLDVFNHIDANLLFGGRNIWCRDIASAVWAASLDYGGYAGRYDASDAWVAPAALILLS